MREGGKLTAEVARPMPSEKIHGEISHITRPVIFGWRAPLIIGRSETPTKKFNGNGFLAVIPVSFIIVGVAILQVSC